MPEGMSELAALRPQIELECEAMKRALYAPAIVASHATIAHKYDVLGAYQHALATHVGEEQAQQEIYAIYSQVVG